MTQTPTPETLLARYTKACGYRSRWQPVWQDCARHALPHQVRGITPGNERSDLFDATAADAADSLASNLMALLVPAWNSWFTLVPGPDVPTENHEEVTRALSNISKTLQGHFDRSNFAVEIHQCLLDCVVSGTATLLVEDAAPGDASALKFTAIPRDEVALEESASGKLDTTYRSAVMSAGHIAARYGALPAAYAKDPDQRYTLIEAVIPEGGAYSYAVLCDDGSRKPILLRHCRLSHSPYISFRWQKTAGETYGRSPVMKVLPDIRTANRVVELILQNASFAVAGMWQADDDGILNIDTIELAPGAIIPKAIGSSGLTPLEMPGNFDVSQLVLEDLRARIRRALFADQMTLPDNVQMTATEVLERSSLMAQALGATYGRLQCELLEPLIRRSLSILKRRGEIPDISLDGRNVVLEYRSPLARAQRLREMQAVLTWLKSASELGGNATQHINEYGVMSWAASALGLPDTLLKSPETQTQ